MVDIDWQHLKEALFSSGGDCVGGVVCVGPGVRAAREAAVCKVINDTLVGILFRPHENQAIR